MVVIGSITVIDSASRQAPNAGAINLFGSFALLALFAVLVVAALAIGPSRLCTSG